MAIFSQNLIDAIRSGEARRTTLINVSFASSFVKNWIDIAGEITVSGVNYLGAGCPVVSGLSDTDSLQAHDITLSFPLEPETEFLRYENVVNAAVTISTAWVHIGTAYDLPIIDMECLGDVLEMDIGEYGLERLDMMCRTPLFDMTRAPLSFYTDSEQQALHAGDSGLSRIAGLVNLEQAGWTLSATGTNTVYIVLNNGVVEDTAGRAVTDENGVAINYLDSVLKFYDNRILGISRNYLSEKYYTKYQSLGGERVDSTDPSYLVSIFGGGNALQHYGPIYGYNRYSPVVLKDGFFQIEIDLNVFTKIVVGASGVLFTEENVSLGKMLDTNITAAFFQYQFYRQDVVHLPFPKNIYEYYTESVTEQNDSTDYNSYAKVTLV